MLAETKRSSLRLLAVLMLALALFTACTSKAAKAQEKIELGQKYLTELNYTEAVASFTEAIELDPENIPAYMGRAEAYIGLKQYDDAKADYTTAIEKTEEQPYTQAEAYIGRAEVNELTEELELAKEDYTEALDLLKQDDVGQKENIAEELVTALKEKAYNAYIQLCMRLGLYDQVKNGADAMMALYANPVKKPALEACLTQMKVGAMTGDLDQYQTYGETLYSMMADYDYADYTLTEQQKEAVEYLRAHKNDAEWKYISGFRDLCVVDPRFLDVLNWHDYEKCVLSYRGSYLLAYRTEKMLEENPQLFSLDELIEQLPVMVKRMQADGLNVRGDYTGVIEIYTEILQQDQSIRAQSSGVVLKRAYFNRAETYVRQGNYALARQDLEHCLEIDGLDSWQGSFNVDHPDLLLERIYEVDGDFLQLRKLTKEMAKQRAERGREVKKQWAEIKERYELEEEVKAEVEENIELCYPSGSEEDDEEFYNSVDPSLDVIFPAMTRQYLQEHAREYLKNY